MIGINSASVTQLPASPVGSKKQQKFNKSKSATINVSELKGGTYFIEIIHGSSKKDNNCLSRNKVFRHIDIESLAI